MTLKIETPSTILFDILWSQFENLNHPTWGECVQNIVLPKKAQVAQTTAQEILLLYSNHLTLKNQVQSKLEAFFHSL
jgi:hypothetical protein